MNKDDAMRILINDGWNHIGAEVIVDGLIEGNLLDKMTESDLLKVSEDYKDR